MACLPVAVVWLLLVLGAITSSSARIVPKARRPSTTDDAKIAADLAEAERLQGEASRVEEAWRGRINEGHVEAQAVIAETQAKADAEAAQRVCKADAELAVQAARRPSTSTRADNRQLAEIEAWRSKRPAKSSPSCRAARSPRPRRARRSRRLESW